MSCINRISIEGKHERHSVPCGKCEFCLSRRASQWRFRLWQEQKVSDSAYFITLTYNDRMIPRSEEGIPQLDKTDIQKFFKRVRKHQWYYIRKITGMTNGEIRKKVKPIRYYACGEYGSKTMRPHYHFIVFNIIKEIVNKIPELWTTQDQWVDLSTGEIIDQKLQMGHVHIGTCNAKTIAYTTKYMLKGSVAPNGCNPPFQIMSKGLGKAYLTKDMIRYHLSNKSLTVRNANGSYQQMPRYYQDMIVDGKKYEGVKLFSDLFKKQNAKKITQEIDKLEQKQYDKETRLGNNYFKSAQEQKIKKQKDINKQSKDNTL